MDEKRKLLLDYLKKNKKSIVTFAKEIGVSTSSLYKFLNQGLDIRLSTWSIIEKHIKK